MSRYLSHGFAALLASCWCACTLFDPLVPDAVDAGPEMPDAGPSYPRIADSIPFLPRHEHYVGLEDLVLGDPSPGAHVIDTSDLTVDGVDYPPARGPIVFSSYWVNYDVLNYAPELAILHVRTLTIDPGVSVRVQGGRALVILAEEIAIRGVLDAGARGSVGGPAGLKSDIGYIMLNWTQSRGQRGTRSNDTVHERDAGGGGGALGTGGGLGGSASGADGYAIKGIRSRPFMDVESIPRLIGGSGGAPTSLHPWHEEELYCPAAQGGAGGGAVLLYARSALEIGPVGGINVGGGGGMGGVATDCGPRGDSTAGGGGGSGGAIHLQSASVTVRGVLAANGGGGGGGAGALLGQSGAAGEDGALTAVPASGGMAGTSAGGRGGTGSSINFSAHLEPGGDGLDASVNGGGGGGGMGFIIIHVAGDGAYDASGSILSPEPLLRLYTRNAL